MKKAFLVAGVLTLAGTAFGAALNPGDTLFKNDPSVTFTPKYTPTLPTGANGGNLIGTLAAPLLGGFTGTMTSNVYRDPSNGQLTFEYILSMSDRSAGDIVRATMGGWMGVTITDAGSDASGSSGTFDSAPEWNDGDPYELARDPQSQGIEIQWRQAQGSTLVGTVIGPGDISAHVFFTTTATGFVQNTAGYIDTTVIGSSNVLVPTPEPASLVVLGAGIAVACFRRRMARA